MNFMNAAQLHLALNHVPVILSITGFIMLMLAMAKSNDMLVKTSFTILVLAGLFCLPVYFSGEGAEEIVENLPGVSEQIIETHEENAKMAFIACLITAGISLVGLMMYAKAGKTIRNLAFVASLASASILGWAAHQGGKIRHTELRKDFVKVTETNSMGAGQEEHEEHD